MIDRKNIPQKSNLLRKNRLKIKEKFSLLNFIFDKERRATIAWLSTFTGGIFIVGYYIMLDGGFAPDINLG